MSNSKLWIQQPVLHRLRRQHLSAAILIVGLVVAWASDRAPLVWAALAILGVISAATVMTYSDGIGKKFSVWVARVIVYPSLVIFALSIAFSRPELVQVGVGSESTHLVVFFTAGIALFGAFGAVLSQLATRHRRTAFLPFGTTAIAMMMGGALGVAAALMAEVAIYRWAPKLSSSEAFQIGNDFEIVEAQVMVNGGGWISIAMLTFLIGILGTAGVLAFFPMRGLPAKREGRKLAMLTRVTGRAQILIGTAGVLGIVLAAIAGLDACLPDGCSPSSLFLSGENPQIAFILAAVAVPSVLALAAAVWRVNIIASVILITVSIGTGWFVWVDDPPFREMNIPGIGLAVDLSQIVDLAFVVIILGFGLSILRSILGGFGDPERRRKVGVLWDVGSFWPRWFHPLAPPAYGPAAVRALRSALIQENARAKTTGQRLVLTAHSQGSVIAAVALSKSLAKPSGLVTYGSPLGHLYSQMFPATGVDDLCDIVDQKLRDFLAKPDQQDPPGHWLNLRRPDTDYIGESLVPVCTNWLVETGIGHSGYELTSEFCLARKVSIAGVRPEPGVVPLDCWET